MLRCPKAVSIKELHYPYGQDTPFCPFRHIPCVLESGDAETCDVAKMLQVISQICREVLDDTWQVISSLSGPLRDDISEVSFDTDRAASEILNSMWSRMERPLIEETKCPADISAEEIYEKLSDAEANFLEDEFLNLL